MSCAIDLPTICADLLLGRRHHGDGYLIGTRFHNEEKDARALARMLAEGELLGALQGCIPLRGTTHANFSIRDPMALLTSLEKLTSRLSFP